MTIAVNHYEILGLPSDITIAVNLTSNQISKAYKSKALELHPDKRLDNPNANSEFQILKSSYDILINKTTRKIFDDDLIIQSQVMERNAKLKRAWSNVVHEEDLAKPKRQKCDVNEFQPARKAAVRVARDDVFGANRGRSSGDFYTREEILARSKMNGRKKSKLMEEVLYSYMKKFRYCRDGSSVLNAKQQWRKM